MAKEPPSGRARPFAGAGRIVAPAALVFCATVVAYLPALSGGFIWNDSDYVTAPALRSLAGLARIWAELGATEQYYPLLHSAFWVQHRLWGDSPAGYHTVTLFLHAASAVLFALILRRLVEDDPRLRPYAGSEWLAALLFALHPVHVESVAWIAEQKNTLSLAFYLASALAYLRFDATRRRGAYVLALGLFVLALQCKTVTATLPAALLVVLWWKRGHLDWRRDVLPLLPWLVLGAAAGIFSSWVERTYGGAQGDEFYLGAAGRVLVAGRAVAFYAGKLLWPFDLNFVYPRWTVDTGAGWQWLFPIGVVAAGLALWMLRQRARGPLAAFLLFVGSLFPALGFVNLYGARYSWVWDHWQYLPDLGPLALAAAAMTAAGRRVPERLRAVGPALGLGLAFALGALTWSHSRMFHDDQTLYVATLERNPGSWFAHYNLGRLWSETPGRREDAIAQYREVTRIKPDHAKAHYNLGVLLQDVPGRLPDAVAEYQEALRLQPGNAEARINLGEAWAAMPGHLEDAIAEYRAALILRPGDFGAHVDLGNALLKSTGHTGEAIEQYREAIRLRPDQAAARFNLAIALAGKPGGLDEAKAQLEAVLRLQPDNPPATALLARIRSLSP